MDPVEFFVWHFVDVPKEFLVGWKNFLLANFHLFSVGSLLKSLFQPWKRQFVTKEGVGFNFDEWFRVFTFNLISRVIGFIIRFFFLLFALAFELFTLLIGPIILLIILLIPLVSLLTYFEHRKNTKWIPLINKAQKDPLVFILDFLKDERGQFMAWRVGIDPNLLSKVVLESATPIRTAGFQVSLLASEGPSQAFLLIAEKFFPLAEALKSYDIKLEDVKAVLAWYDRREADRRKQARFWDLDNLKRRPGLGSFWSYGYTINLDRYSLDLSKEQPFASHLVGRDKEVSRMENILSRSGQSNVLLVGDEGVGKKTVVFQLANSIRQGKIYPPLRHKRVLEVNLSSILGEGRTDIEAQNIFAKVLEEARWAGNIILLIPGIDRFVIADKDRIDLSSVFDRLAGDNKLQIIGITSPELYQKYIYPNPIINKLFAKIDVEPPSKEQALEISQDYVFSLEAGNKIIFTYQGIREAVDKADRYVTDIPFPEKALDLLDEVAVFSKRSGTNIIKVAQVDEVLSVKTKIPIGEITQNEKDRLINLEDIIHKRLVNQEQAIIDLSSALRRARVDIGSKQKALGVFLFLGPTGVGKTETAKALAEAYFGNEDKLVRFDMNEFQDEGAAVRLLGDFTRNQPGVMAQKLRENPFCVLLLDEIEKSSRQVLNLFLSAFDEGYLTDNFGKKIILRDMIIICTSNAGAEFVRQKVTNGIETENFKPELIDYLLKEGIFTPEFVNRFDSVVVYQPLSLEHLKKVARIMLDNLNKRLKEKGITVKITDKLLEQIAVLGNDPVFGARPMRRLIQDKIEAPLAQKILLGNLTAGSEVDFNLG